jgi:hypothetical protein
MTTEVQTLDVEVDKENYKEKVYDILVKLRPRWEKEAIQFKASWNVFFPFFFSERC